MAPALMAWVCFVLILARLNDAESHRVERRDHQALRPASEAPAEERFFAPVWHFLEGGRESANISDFNQPHFRCTKETLDLRVSLIRYKNLRLEDGTRLLALPDTCPSSIHIYRWWLLVKLSYAGCLQTVQAEDGTAFQPLRLHYSDRLLEQNMTGTAVCRNPGAPPQRAPPTLVCRKTHVALKLPGGTKLKKVKQLDLFASVGYKVRQQKTNDALYVEISKIPLMDSTYEVIYLDSTGNLSMVLAACYHKLAKTGKHHVKRALEDDNFNVWGFDTLPTGDFDPDAADSNTDDDTNTDSDNNTDDDGNTDGNTDDNAGADTDTGTEGDAFYDTWGFEEIPAEPFDPETTTAATTTTSPGTTATTTTTPTTASPVDETDYDSEEYNLWGFEEPPEEPFDGVITEPTTTTTSASPVTTTTPVTTTSSTEATTTSETTVETTVAPTTTASSTTTTTAAPVTTAETTTSVTTVATTVSTGSTTATTAATTSSATTAATTTTTTTPTTTTSTTTTTSATTTSSPTTTSTTSTTTEFPGSTTTTMPPAVP